MALVKCSECGKDVSEKASACPNCGAPVMAPHYGPPPPAIATPVTQAHQKPKTRPIAWVGLVLIIGIGFAIFRARTSEKAAPPSAGLAAALRQPTKVISERMTLKEGQAAMYSFKLNSDARVEVRVEASPKNVDVMLMTGEELKKFQQAMGKLFGGKFTHRQSLSKQATMKMNETEILPAGNWAIVVQRPQESILLGDNTTANIEVTAY